MMVKVKICGITNVRDARRSARAGADALGFNFVSGTPRYVQPDRARAIVLELPPFVSTVGVFMDSLAETVREVVEYCGLEYAQLHGHETPDMCAKLRGIKLLKALRVRSVADVRQIEHYSVDGYVLDTYVPGVPGGTGKTFDWGLARHAPSTERIILAGGLTPENVAEAVAAARPYGVDVSSGVEIEPGKKDKELVEWFIRIAKSVDL